MRSFAPCLILCATLAAACGRAPEPAPPSQTYELSGQILAVRPEQGEVLIRHGDIPGFMPAMTMPYKVEPRSLLDGRTAGDLVTATLEVADLDARLTALTATGHAPIGGDAPRTFPAATNVTILAPGDLAPATPLEASDGRTLSLVETAGRATALTFIYTTCPLPDFCPLMDRRFAEVQRRAAGDPRLDGHVRLISVSFDAETDTPARLAEHAASLGADPSVWQFATPADPADIDRFAATFGVNVIREADGTITHNLQTVVLDREGRVVALHAGNTSTADELLADLARAVGR
ncbi:MAG: SCO family protein [Vicinamibacterales bacterium]